MFEISMLNNFGKRLMCDIIEQFLIVEVQPYLTRPPKK